METFRYTALDDGGRLVRGAVEARDEGAALQTLRAQGLRPTQVRSGGTGLMDLLHTELRFGKTFTKADLVLFLEELAMLMGEGVSLKQALNLSADLRRGGESQAVVRRLEEALIEGRSLADALDGEARHFPAPLRALVRAGEESGALEQVLASTAAYMRRTMDTRQKIVSALTYPMILLAATVASIVLLMTVVVPQFEPVFRSAGEQLPAATRVLMGLSTGMQQYGWILGLMIAGGAAVLLLAMRDKAAQVRVSALKARLPWFGPLGQEIESARFARTLSVTLKNGLSLLRALEVCRDGVSDPAFRAHLNAVMEAVRKGDRLGQAFEQEKLGTPILRKLILLGEQSGQYDDMLAKAADLLEQKAQRRIAGGLALLVPAVTILMGVVVGGTMYAIFAAIFSVNTLV